MDGNESSIKWFTVKDLSKKSGIRHERGMQGGGKVIDSKKNNPTGVTKPRCADRNSKYLTVQELAELLRLDESTIYKWVDQKRLPYVDLGKGKKRCLRFSSEEINTMLRTHSVNPAQGNDPEKCGIKIKEATGPLKAGEEVCNG